MATAVYNTSQYQEAYKEGTKLFLYPGFRSSCQFHPLFLSILHLHMLLVLQYILSPCKAQSTSWLCYLSIFMNTTNLFPSLLFYDTYSSASRDVVF